MAEKCSKPNEILQDTIP